MQLLLQPLAVTSKLNYFFMWVQLLSKTNSGKHPAFGLSSALSGWRPRLSLRWFSWGSRALGGLRMFGARVFSVPASCLAGWGCCSPHTLLNIYMEEPYEHKRAHTHRCTLKHSHWCKNRCSQTPIVLICCCFKTYFVILVMCAAQ